MTPLVLVQDLEGGGHVTECVDGEGVASGKLRGGVRLCRLFAQDRPGHMCGHSSVETGREAERQESPGALCSRTTEDESPSGCWVDVQEQKRGLLGGGKGGRRAALE